MKEIIILISNAGNVKNYSNQLMLHLIEFLYKKGIKVTAFSKSFPNNFPAYIARKNLSSILLKKSAKIIADISKNADAIICIDFPMNIIASMTKNILIKKNCSKIPIIIWYVIDFQNHLYFYNKTNNKYNFLDKRLIKLDYKNTSNIDVIIAGSNKIKEKLLYIYKIIEDIKIIHPYFSAYNNNNNIKIEKDKSIIIFYNKEDTIFKCTAAYAQYLKENNEIYKLKIIGYDKVLKENINKLGISEYITFIEEDDNLAISNAIKTANAIIIHNTKDSFYNQLISAWYYKTIPIIDSESSSAEIATDEKNALIYNSKNPISIISKIKKMNDNKQYYELNMKVIDDTENMNKILNIIENFNNK